MWIWWIIPLTVLIACAIFAYRMIVSSYEFLPADKRYLWRFRKDRIYEETAVSNEHTNRSLQGQLKVAEDNNTFYQVQFIKLQERMKALEDKSGAKNTTEIISPKYESEEDWKEMYYEENQRKEKLENELDITQQTLEEAQISLKDITEINARWVEMQSDYESRLLKMQSQHNYIQLLQNQLTAATEREKELEQVLISEITSREKYMVLQKQYVELQSENDDLRRRTAELGKNNINADIRLRSLARIESKLSLCEDEKMRLIERLESNLLG